MTKGQKILLLVTLSLLLLLGTGWFVLKTTVEKIINSQETRTEIGRLVEQHISGFIHRPKVMISSLRLSGLSQVDIGQTQVSSSGSPVLSATGYVRCGLIKLLVSGNCLADLMLDFGADGQTSLRGLIPRNLILEGTTTPPVRITGRVEDLAVQKLIPEVRGGTRQLLQVNPGKLSGDLTVAVTMARSIAVKGSLTGSLRKTEFAAAIAGRTQKAVQDIPVHLGFDATRLFFEKPLQVSLFGLAIQYAGELRLAREPEWNGKVSASGPPLSLGYIPRVFRCKKSPQNAAAFKIRGPFSGPDCG